MTVNLQNLYGHIPEEDTLEDVIAEVRRLHDWIASIQPTSDDSTRPWYGLGATETALWKIRRRLERLARTL